MRASRAVLVGGASAVIVAAGWATAPDRLEVSANGDGPDTTPGDAGTSRTVDGPVVSNLRGDYQVRLVIEDGAVVDVEFPVAGTEAAESRRVNAMALPELEESILEQQSGDVEYVSGASYTSPAMVESARAAFEAAGLQP